MATRLAGRVGYPRDNPFAVTLHPERLSEPKQWRKPKRIFVDSMGDLFHEDVPFWFIDDVIQAMFEADWHTYMILTKRPERAAEYVWWRANLSATLTSCRVLPPNLLLGVSAEDQATADERIPALLQIPAPKLFVSCEPLLGPIDLKIPRACAASIDWVIAGGESGPDARPVNPAWVRGLRDQCQVASVPFFFKSWGEWCPIDLAPKERLSRWHYPWNYQAFTPGGPDDVARVGKAYSGRMLDGRVWDEMPR
jgi:protein gp37